MPLGKNCAMMKQKAGRGFNLVFYFTGTGNSRFIAQKIADVMQDELVSMNRHMRQRVLEPFTASYAFYSEKPFVVVCPTYCWHIPKVVESFLKDSRFLGTDRMYFLLTCGSGTGNAAAHAKKICENLSLHFCGLTSFLMPENYITLFRAPEPDEAVGIIRAAIPKAESVAMQILSGRTLADEYAGSSFPDRLLPLYYRFFIHDRKFRVKESCTGCSVCARLCPMANIRMKNGRPSWHGSCTQCQACIAVCPVDAIEYGQRSRGKRRYYLFADGRQKFPRISKSEEAPSV